MALEPIRIFQQPTSGIEQVLSRGTGALNSILRDAVQVGQNMTNLQAKQEQDTITEQRRGIALRQRRAENFQQDWEDTRAFDRGVEEFDQQFGENARQFDNREENRESQFSRSLEETSLGRLLSADRLEVSKEQGERRLDLSEDQLQFSKDQMMQTAKKDDLLLKKYKAEISAAKDGAARARVEDARKDWQDKRQQEVLAYYNDMSRAGNKAEAQSVVREFIFNPAYGFPASTVDKIAKDTGLLPKGYASSSKADGKEGLFQSRAEAEEARDRLSRASVLADGSAASLSPTQVEELASAEQYLANNPTEEELDIIAKALQGKTPTRTGGKTGKNRKNP